MTDSTQNGGTTSTSSSSSSSSASSKARLQPLAAPVFRAQSSEEQKAHLNELFSLVHDSMGNIQAFYDSIKYQGFNPTEAFLHAIETVGPTGAYQLAMVFAVRGFNQRNVGELVVKCDGRVQGDVKVGTLFKDGHLLRDPRKSAVALSPGRLTIILGPEIAFSLAKVEAPARFEHQLPAYLQFPAAMSIHMTEAGFTLFLDWYRMFQERANIRSSPDGEALAMEHRVLAGRVNGFGEHWDGFATEDNTISANAAKALLLKYPNRVKPLDVKPRSLKSQLEERLLSSLTF